MQTTLPAAVVLLGLITAGASAQEQEAVFFNVGGLDADELDLVDTLQGLVNRDGPRMMQSYSSYYQDSSWNWDWKTIYQQEYGLSFSPEMTGLGNLLQRFDDDYAGVVVYDPDIDGTRKVAMTMSGIDNLLPVTQTMINNHSLLAGKPVVHDLRDHDFADSVAAYQWALTNVMPRANRQVAHAPGGGREVDGKYLGWGFEAFDYAVQNKGVVFNLTFNDEDVTSFGGRVIDGDPAQAAMYRSILDNLDDHALVLGYGEWENDWFTLVGEHGHRTLHWGDNLSTVREITVA